MTRLILATSGGFVPGPTQMSARVGAMLAGALTRTGKDRPKVCVVNTALGDMWDWQAVCFDAFAAAGCDVSALRLFPQPDPFERITGADLVWVGGGSVANLLALWRLHGVDTAMREAWESGVILSGVSAGSLCWHVGGTTDSFGPTLQPVTNGLGFLPYANGVHFDSEAQRRPLITSLIADGTLPALAFATDDRVGVWYEDLEPTTVVADVDVNPSTGPAAYRLELVGSDVVETRVGVGSRF
ncbi:MAG TPA: peptidase E [Acidimicrobiales bacterium]|nr:peptidase E [Acidimicrobiales bacterium]